MSQTRFRGSFHRDNTATLRHRGDKDVLPRSMDLPRASRISSDLVPLIESDRAVWIDPAEDQAKRDYMVVKDSVATLDILHTDGRWFLHERRGARLWIDFEVVHSFESHHAYNRLWANPLWRWIISKSSAWIIALKTQSQKAQALPQSAVQDSEEVVLAAKGRLERLKGDAAYITLKLPSGTEFAGRYPAEDITRKGILEGDVFTCNLVRVGSDTKVQIRPLIVERSTPEEQKARWEALQKRISADYWRETKLD